MPMLMLVSLPVVARCNMLSCMPPYMFWIVHHTVLPISTGVDAPYMITKVFSFLFGQQVYLVRSLPVS